jgi:uncharacterized glyoxalase superfamily protein PhnB
MAASLAFYRRLGLDFGTPAADGHIQATLPGGLQLALDTEDIIASFNPNWQRPQRGGRINLGFQCEGPNDVDTVYRDLVAAGYHGELKPFDAFWGHRWATVHDPDGNGIDLYAPLKN